MKQQKLYSESRWAFSTSITSVRQRTTHFRLKCHHVCHQLPLRLAPGCLASSEFRRCDIIRTLVQDICGWPLSLIKAEPSIYGDYNKSVPLHWIPLVSEDWIDTRRSPSQKPCSTALINPHWEKKWSWHLHCLFSNTKFSHHHHQSALCHRHLRTATPSSTSALALFTNQSSV